MIVTINGVIVSNTNSDFTEDKKRIKELDEGRLTVINDSNDEAFDVDSQVTVVIDGVTSYLLLAEDDFDRVAKSPFLYEHKLSLIESTSYLEGITLPNFTFRNAPNGVIGDGITYTVWDQLVRLREIAKLVKTTTTARLWDYDTAIIPHLGVTLQAYTSLIKGKQLTLNKLNAREALDLMFSQIDAEVRMTNFTDVRAEFINVKNNEIDTTDLIVYKGRQEMNQYADRVDLFIENGISEDNLNKQAIIYPSKSAWSSVRGTDSFLTSDEFIMEVPYGIQDVLKFEIFANITSSVLGSPFVETIEVDITELLLEKPAYDAKAYDLADPAVTVSRASAIYFEKGGTRLLGFHEKLDKFAGIGGVYFSYRYLLSYAVTKLFPSPANPVRFSTDIVDYEDFMFRLTYVTRQNERLRIEKSIPNKQRAVYFNQGERIPDIEKLGNKAREDVERIGNKTLTVGKRVFTYGDLFQLGDYIGDYIADNVHNYIDKGEYISIAELTKGAPKISLDVGINTENRDTTIDDKNAVIRHDIIDEYIEVSLAIAPNTALINTDGVKRYAEMFNTGAIVKANPVEVVEWVNDGSAIYKILGCVSKGTANVIKFDWGFESVNLIGRAAKLVDGLWTSDYIDYTGGDEYARLADFEFRLAGGIEPDIDTFAEHVKLAQGLPEIDRPTTTTTDIYFDSVVRYNLLKDGGEIEKLTYQMGHYDITGFGYIGEKMSTNNPLVVKDKETLYLYKSSTPFEKSNFIGKYDERLLMTNGTPGAQDEIQVTETITADSINITVISGSSFYWALGNFERETYYIMNSLTIKAIKINFRENRS